MSDPRSMWRPHARTGPPVLSSLAVAVVQVAGTIGAGQRQPERVQLDALGFALLLLGPALLLFRHRHPSAVMAGTTAVTVGYLFAGYPYGPAFAAMAVAFFGAVQQGRRRTAWACGAAFFFSQLVLAYAVPRDWQRASGWQPNGWQEVGVAGVLLFIATGAELAKVTRERAAATRAAAEEAQRRRADEERLRMARELHDILAHSISLIHVQAGVALELIDTRPEQARSALTAIKAASKEALGEVRQVLGTLRGPDTAAPRTTAPGLDRLDELVEQAGRAGLAVTVVPEGDPERAPAAVQRAAFRIVQEALTNVIRHSTARTATVSLRATPDALTVQIDDPGPADGSDAGGTGADGGDAGGTGAGGTGAGGTGAGGSDPGGSGAGLIGMRERVAAFGGTLEAGPYEAGFRVRARLTTRGDG